jgi:hypothetical protein
VQVQPKSFSSVRSGALRDDFGAGKLHVKIGCLTRVRGFEMQMIDSEIHDDLQKSVGFTLFYSCGIHYCKRKLSS